LSPVSIVNPDAGNPVLLICEHASRYIPSDYNGLGLSEEEQKSHIAWDPGALCVAEKLSHMLDATLVSATHSRLLYDCNRPPEAADSIPERSELFDVPGNAALSVEDRKKRVEAFYDPVQKGIRNVINAFAEPPVIITIHSFTPVYFGKKRDVELGILHDEDRSLADAMLLKASALESLVIRLNEPYSAADGVTHTLKVHGVDNGFKNVMLEIRNDLIVTEEQCETMAKMLYSLTGEALQHCGVDIRQGGF